MLSLSSCETTTYATAQTDIYDDYEQYEVRSTVGFDVIIRYGTPYFYRGDILYYFYDGIYYYPYWYNDYWYVKAYTRPFNHLRYKPYFRPSYRDYRFRPGIYRGYNRPHYKPHNHRPNNHIHKPYSSRPNNGIHGNNGHMNRPPNNGNMNHQPHHRPNGGSHGHFGGRR